MAHRRLHRLTHPLRFLPPVGATLWFLQHWNKLRLIFFVLGFEVVDLSHHMGLVEGHLFAELLAHAFGERQPLFLDAVDSLFELL